MRQLCCVKALKASDCLSRHQKNYYSREKEREKKKKKRKKKQKRISRTYLKEHLPFFSCWWRSSSFWRVNLKWSRKPFKLSLMKFGGMGWEVSTLQVAFRCSSRGLRLTRWVNSRCERLKTESSHTLLTQGF